MAKRVSRRSQGELLIHKWWVNLLLAFIGMIAAYGFASWAIDSGNMLAYALTAAAVAWGTNRAFRSVRQRT